MQKLQPQTKIKVDNVDYIVQLYSPTVGLPLYAKLMRILGQPIVKFIKSFSDMDMTGLKKGEKFDLSKIDLSEVDFDSIGEALQTIFVALPEEQFLPLIQEILGSTFLGTGEMSPVNEIFETQFTGRYLHLFKLVGKTVGVQYADFLPGLIKRASAARAVSVSQPISAQG